jgi:transcriptional regulator with GAF, ATPase, and Fis domain
LEECERLHILNVLEKCQWQISGEQGAAEILDLPASTLRSKMKKLGIFRNGAKDLVRN